MKPRESGLRATNAADIPHANSGGRARPRSFIFPFLVRRLCNYQRMTNYETKLRGIFHLALAFRTV